MARQRTFFHKCHRCIYRGQVAEWEPESPPVPMLNVHAAEEPAHADVKEVPLTRPVAKPAAAKADKPAAKPAAVKPAAVKPTAVKPTAASPAAAKPAAVKAKPKVAASAANAPMVRVEATSPVG